MGGRVVDWGPLPGPVELARRTEDAAGRPPGQALLAREEVDEVSIVSSWLAGNDAREVPFPEVLQRVPRLQLCSRPSWPDALLEPLAPGAPP